MYPRLLTNTFFIILFIFALFPAVSFAADATAVGNMLCTVSGWALGNTGKGIATLSIVMLGILALLNKMSWNFAILHVVGIALLEGAAGVVNAINAGGTGC
jgi:type IV secretory pathway VirB2 component (pilin)